MNQIQHSARPLLAAVACLLLAAACASSASAGKITYTYDAAGRLRGADYGGGNLGTYAYDANGNLLDQANVSGATDADLRITKSTSVISITSGVNFTYTLTVTNDGPDPASGATVTDELPLGLALVSASSQQGACTLTGRTFECDLGVLGVGQSVKIVMTVFHAVPGLWQNEAQVDADQNDPDPADNSSSDSSTGTAPNDNDSDGMPNWWETLHGLSAFSSSGQNGAGGDPDGDGITNFMEWLADTDPRDRDSFLRIESASLHPAGGAEFNIKTSPNRVYTLEYTPDLDTAYTPIETKDGSGLEISFHDMTALAGRGFFRVGVEFPSP